MKLKKFKFNFPSTYTILMVLTALMAVLTYIIPAGEYEMVKNEVLNKLVPIVGTYHEIKATPQGIIDVLMAPIQGFYNPATAEARAVDIAVFVIIIGAYLSVVTETGAIDAGIAKVMARLKGREQWMIPILMALFAMGGTVYGMAEETLPFYTILVPIMLAAGYDTVVGAAIVMVGAGIGCLGSTINPFATVVASNAAYINFLDGIGIRVAILVVGWLMCTIFVMRYAAKIKADPTKSVTYKNLNDDKAHFLGQSNQEIPEFTLRRKIILAEFALTFGVMIWGVSSKGWWMGELSTLFIGSSILAGILAGMSEKTFSNRFITGAQDLLGVALIIVIARGIVVVMDNGHITHTILHYTESWLAGLPPIPFINAIYWIEAMLCLIVPSSSGLAVLSMPIFAPLADFAHVSREMVVTAYQSASGLPNLITPTSGVVMGGLALSHVPYVTWCKWIAPLLAGLIVMIMILLSIGVML